MVCSSNMTDSEEDVWKREDKLRKYWTSGGQMKTTFRSRKQQQFFLSPCSWRSSRKWSFNDAKSHMIGLFYTSCQPSDLLESLKYETGRRFLWLPSPPTTEKRQTRQKHKRLVTEWRHSYLNYKRFFFQEPVPFRKYVDSWMQHCLVPRIYNDHEQIYKMRFAAYYLSTTCGALRCGEWTESTL